MDTAPEHSGDPLFELVYAELRALAGSYLRLERPGHTLQPTALVNEAYVRLAPAGPWKDRAHFYNVAAMAMRRVLVNHARDRKRLKRGGGAQIERLEPFNHADETDAIAPGQISTDPVDLIALDDALDQLAALDSRQVQVVQLRYFGGFSVEQTAEVLGISPAQVKRDWVAARAFLRVRMGQAGTS